MVRRRQCSLTGFSVSKATTTAMTRLLDTLNNGAMVVPKNLKNHRNFNVRLAKQAVQRKLPGIIKQMGYVQEYSAVRSTSAARKAWAAGPTSGTIKVTRRKVGGSVGKGAIMQHGANVTATVKIATRDSQAERAKGAMEN